MNERSIFIEALDIADPSEQAAYLERACGNDDALRRRVERLLHTHGQAGGFMNAPAAERVGLSDERHVLESPGMTIGSYKLMEQIGEGGFGLVFVAEQQEPVRRKVALKVLKPGMDTRHVVARFEAERQALAIMDHPNIATVHDGGATPSGRPYFVMELVQGIPITEFCDQNHLSPRQRLELFVSVCQAVQHAHQKGIIHRDLKPSNILVATHDKTPVPKVIDFGVAKSLGPELTDKTLFTGVAQMVGTPLYMSPEQAGQSGLDIDTRSDIYSLGVLLYELLTGTTPFDKARFKQAAYDEICRIVREEDPPRPSARLSNLSNPPTPRLEADSLRESSTLVSVAAQRQTEPARLTKLVRGELDWIVMKALDKDRARRYESASAFAMDVQCYLADKPVSAGPPTVGYRFRKFARRNRRGLLLTGVIGCAVLLAVSAIGWAVRDRSARKEEAQRDEEARRARVGGQLQFILDDVVRLEREQHWPEALDAARRAADLLARGEVDAEIAGRVQDTIRDLELVRLLEDVRAKSEWEGGGFNYRETAERYAAAFRDGGLEFDRLTVEEAAQRLRSRPAVVAALVPVLHHWAGCRQHTGDKAGAMHLVNVAGLVEPDPWRQKVWQAIWKSDLPAVLALAAAPDLDQQAAATLTYLAGYLKGADRVDAAIGVLLIAQRQYPADFWVHYDLGVAFKTKGRSTVEQAVGCYRTAVALRPRNTNAWNNLGSLLRGQKKLADAIACYQKAIELDPHHAMVHSNLGLALQEQGKLAEAIACHRKAIELDPKNALAQNSLGSALYAQHKLPEALAAFHKAIELDPQLAAGYHNRGVVLRDQHKLSDAIADYQKAIQLDPKYADAYVNLGITLHAQKKLSEAVAAIKQAIELDSQSAVAYYNLGSVLMAQHDWPGAIACYRKTVELNPKVAAVHYNLGVALHRQDDLPGAIAAFQQAMALDPKQPVFQDTYRKALALKPKYAQALVEEGNVLLAQQKWAEAVAAFRKAIELVPKFAPAHRDLGVTHLKQGLVDEAIACLKKSIEFDAEDAQAHTQLGDALSRKGMPDEALAAYREAIRVKPDHGDAFNHWAWLLASPADAKARNPAEAVKLAKKAVELAPQRGDRWNTLGVAHYRAGAWKDALAALEKARELRQGGDAGDWFFVAMSHWRLDQKDDARKWYDRAVQWMEKNAPQNVELLRFRAEAAELGMKK